MSLVAVDLMLHGIVVADAMRPHNSLLAGAHPRNAVEQRLEAHVGNYDLGSSGIR